MNTNKNLINATVDEITTLFFDEIDRLSQEHTTNTAKTLGKINLVLDLLASVPEDVTFTVEGVRGNGKIRDAYLPNAGSVVECIVKYHQTNANEIAKAFSGLDTKVGAIKYEIKASLSANCLATPSESETTILVNKCGVFSIRKADIGCYTNKQGRLPYNQECGTPIQWLMARMGY